MWTKVKTVKELLDKVEGQLRPVRGKNYIEDYGTFKNYKYDRADHDGSSLEYINILDRMRKMNPEELFGLNFLSNQRLNQNEEQHLLNKLPRLNGNPNEVDYSVDGILDVL